MRMNLKFMQKVKKFFFALLHLTNMDFWFFFCLQTLWKSAKWKKSGKIYLGEVFDDIFKDKKEKVIKEIYF